MEVHKTCNGVQPGILTQSMAFSKMLLLECRQCLGNGQKRNKGIMCRAMPSLAQSQASPMTCEEFITNTRRVVEASEVPDGALQEFYTSVKDSQANAQ